MQGKLQAHRARLRKVAVSATACAVTASLTLFMTGCKYSDVLTEYIEDPVNGTLNPHVTPTYKDVKDAPEDATMASTHATKSNDNINNQVQELPVYDPDAPDSNLAADQRVYASDSPNTEPATQGTLPSANAKGASEEPKQQEEEGETDTQPDEEKTGGDDSESEPDATTDDETDEPSDEDETPAGKGGKGQVYNDDSYDEIPEKVGTVAAAGQYATIVQMLCGKGHLVAADADWIKKVKKLDAFSGKGMGSVKAGWSGNGDSASEANIDALIEAAPDLLLYDGSSSVVSEKQIKKLTDAGITVKAMPALGEVNTSDADIKQAVKIVGAIMEDATEGNSKTSLQMANQYVKDHDTVIDRVKDDNKGYSYKAVNGTSYAFIYQGKSQRGTETDDLNPSSISTAFIDSWVSASKSSTAAKREYSGNELYLNGQTISLSEGVGMSAHVSTQSFVLLDYYLQIAGVVNNAYDGASPVPAGSTASLPYPVIPGTPENMFKRKISLRSTPSPLWYNPTGTNTDSSWVTVGDSSFPAVITRDETMEKKVVKSAGKANGLYNTGKPYAVLVMPEGLAGSWADGTVESFLAAPWAQSVFQSLAGDNPSVDTSDSDQYVVDFYSEYYRCSDVSSAVSGYGVFGQAKCPQLSLE